MDNFYIEICQSGLVHLPMDGLKKYYKAFPNKNDKTNYHIICEDCLDLFTDAIANEVVNRIKGYWNEEQPKSVYAMNTLLHFVDYMKIPAMFYKFGLKPDYGLYTSIKYSITKEEVPSNDTTVEEPTTDTEESESNTTPVEEEETVTTASANSRGIIYTPDGDIFFTDDEEEIPGDTPDEPTTPGEDDNPPEEEPVDPPTVDKQCKECNVTLKFKDESNNQYIITFTFNQDSVEQDEMFFINLESYIKLMLNMNIFFEQIPETDVLKIMKDVMEGHIVSDEDPTVDITSDAQFRCSGCNRIVDTTIDTYCIKENIKYCLNCAYAMAIDEARKHVGGLDDLGIGLETAESNIYSIHNTTGYKIQIISRANNLYDMGFTFVYPTEK